LADGEGHLEGSTVNIVVSVQRVEPFEFLGTEGAAIVGGFSVCLCFCTVRHIYSASKDAA
jgi:hypothetical protein